MRYILSFCFFLWSVNSILSTHSYEKSPSSHFTVKKVFHTNQGFFDNSEVLSLHWLESPFEIEEEEDELTGFKKYIKSVNHPTLLLLKDPDNFSFCTNAIPFFTENSAFTTRFRYLILQVFRL